MSTGGFTIDRSFAAPREQIWDAFTQPDLMARWMWAGLGENPRASVDLRPGGEYRVAIDEKPGKDAWPAGERAFEGTFVEIDRPTRLVYTLRWDAPVGYNQLGTPVADERVEVEFDEGAGATLVRYSHTGIPDDGVSVEGHHAATDAMFAMLDGVLGDGS